MNHDLENMVQALLGFAIICFVVIMFFYACFYLFPYTKNYPLSSRWHYRKLSFRRMK